MKLCMMGAAVLLSVAGMASAAVEAAAPAAAPAEVRATADGRNAALYYWRAAYAADRDFLRQIGEALSTERNAEWTAGPEIAAKLAQNQSYVDQFLTATRIDKCDFGIAYEDGFMAMLPHLSPLRAGVRVLLLDSHRLMAEGKPDEAAERIAGIYRVAGHVRNDNVLISSLVSIAVASLAGDEAMMFAKAGKLTPAGRDAIVAALQPLNRTDGFNTKQCIETERRLTVDHLRRVLKGDDAGKKFLAMGVVEGNAERDRQIAELNEAAVEQALVQMSQMLKDSLVAWDVKDYDDEYKRIHSKAESGGYGLIAQALAPSFGKAKEADVKAGEKVREVLKVLSESPTAAPAAPAGK